MSRSKLWLSGLCSCLMALGCDGASEPRSMVADDPAMVADDPEIVVNAAGAVSEADIHAALVQGNLEVQIALTKTGEGSLLGAIELELNDVSAGEPQMLGTAELSFEQGTARAVHRLVFEDVELGFDRPSTAPLVIDWRVNLPPGVLLGKRSVYAALGNLELQLRGPTELTPGESSPVRVVVREVGSLAPVENGQVLATLGTSDPVSGEVTARELFRGTTDADGELLETITLPDGVAAGTLRVEVTAPQGQIWNGAELSLRQDSGLYLSSDKTIYQPGQSVELRLLALEGVDKRPMQASEVVFEAKDAKGNKVFKRAALTDEFGVAAVRVPTDARVNEGEWGFSAMLGEQKTSLSLPVERYNLPKLMVEVRPEALFALPGELIRGVVDARYLFGEPVASGQVEIVGSVDSVPLASAVGNTDAQGVYTFELELPASAFVGSGKQLELQATVTDAAEQREQGRGGLALSEAPVVIDVLSDPATPTLGIENRLYVLVSDPLGRPLVADVQIEGLGDPGNLTTSAAGVVSFAFTPTGFDPVAFEVSAVDGGARTGTKAVSLGSPMAPGLLMRTDRALYRVGDTATLAFSADPGVQRVAVDVYRGAAGVHSATLDVVDGLAQLELRLTAEMRGLLVADAVALTRTGEYLRASRRLLVDPEDRLQILITADQESYRPGAEASLSVQVTDLQGNPQVASVGLSVVNEASFALGGEPQTGLFASFALDQRLLPLTFGGRSSLDLLGAAALDERNALGEVLFLDRSEITLPRFDYNSVASEPPLVRAALEDKLRFDGQALINATVQEQSVFSIETFGSAVLARANQASDPFGKRYQAALDMNQFTLMLTSRGPDETIDTADDSSVTFNLFDTLPEGAGFPGGAVFPVAAAGAAPGADPQAPAPTDPASAPEQGAKGPTVRSDFRETVYMNSTLITDATGHAQVSFPLAHSITTWRASADGSTEDGRLGAARQSFRTFQSFFVDFDLPTRLTVGDEIELPAVVYNYLAEPATVDVTLDAAAWLGALTPLTQQVTLLPSEVRAVKFRVQILQAGEQALTLRGSADGLEDALVRSARVVPNGQREDETVSGSLVDTQVLTLSIPTDALEGGTALDLVLTPGFAAEAVQGVDSLLQEPNGCFEQTTATAWPNTLATQYLDDTGQLDEEQRAQAVDLVTRGYQRLLTFESPTGGYNWWGDGEAGNRILTAIMIWHLKDLESLIEIDTDTRDRALEWLVGQQQADGSWAAGDALHAGNEVLSTSVERATAFISWALSHTGWADDAVARAAGYLSAHLPPESDLYASALSANALSMALPNATATSDLLQRLDTLKETRAEGQVVWASETPSWTGASGNAAAIETTGLVAYGLVRAGAFPEASAGALRFIIANKDSVGTWYNTQATMNALRALSVAVSPQASDATGTLTVLVNGEVAQSIEVSPATGDVFRRFDLNAFALSGDNSIELQYAGTGEVNYQLTRQVYRPVLPAPEGPFSLAVGYSATATTVGEPIEVMLTATNNDVGIRDQVLVRLGRAPGFLPREEDLQSLLNSGLIDRYEVRQDDITLYLMGMQPGEARALPLRLTPSMAVDATAPASSIYSYYEPNLRQVQQAQRFTVVAP